MVCFYFYHTGEHRDFHDFLVFLFGGISGAFFCVPACFFWCGFPVFFVVLFLVSFGDFAGGIFCAFPGAFFTVFWCFFPCFFSCLSLFFSIYVFPWWWSCFLPCFFSWFLGVFSVLFFVLFVVFFFVSLSCFFSCIFSFFFSYFFSSYFFPALGGTRDKQPQHFAFWPVLFSVLFLVVTTSEDRIYTIYIYIISFFHIYIYISIVHIYIYISFLCGEFLIYALQWDSSPLKGFVLLFFPSTGSIKSKIQFFRSGSQ